MILERETELAVLHALVDDLQSSGGRVALIRGEAGIGKTTLVDRFLSTITDRVHILEGACDDLVTPQPFGPIYDIARAEPSISVALSQDDRRGVMDALLDLLDRALRPTVIVLEDTQWADEATLDVIRFLGRRIARTNGVLVLTYRSGAVDGDHPLRQVIGDLPPRNLLRIQLDGLTANAVASMVGSVGLDPEEVLTLTGGNPLFVAEVVRTGVDHVPSSIQDSVLARASKLSPLARRVLDLVAVTPGESELTLIEHILGESDRPISECERSGLLVSERGTVAFSHELTRRAIEASLSPAERRRLNEAVLGALSETENPARLVYHARQAGDIDAIVEFAPLAARAAMGMESHREALAQFHLLEPHLDRVNGPERAAILDDWARSDYLQSNSEAPDIVTRAIALRRTLEDDHALARTLVFAVRVYEVHGQPDLSAACAAEAVAILEPHPPGADLALAIGQQAWLELAQGTEAEGSRLADRALTLAADIGDDLTRIRALITKGACDYSLGDMAAVELVEHGHRLAQQLGYRFEETFALTNLTGMAGDVRDVMRAKDLAQRTRDTAIRYELRPLEAYAGAQLSELLMWLGDWTAAEDEATEALGTDAHAEAVIWRILGLIQARRGRTEAPELLDRMRNMAGASGELQHVDPAAAAIAEHMWLTNETKDHVRWVQQVFDRGMETGPPWPSGALAFWWWKLGRLNTIPESVPDFYRPVMEGRWQEGARFWEERGVPYEQALALLDGDDESAIQALRIFEGLGADATAARTRRTLRDRGVKVARGSARSTRDHVAGLTARQAEVLDLVAEGLSNAEIADRLFVSHRTIENHVAAILMKLDAPSRDIAVGLAKERGILEAG